MHMWTWTDVHLSLRAKSKVYKVMVDIRARTHGKPRKYLYLCMHSLSCFLSRLFKFIENVCFCGYLSWLGTICYHLRRDSMVVTWHDKKIPHDKSVFIENYWTQLTRFVWQAPQASHDKLHTTSFTWQMSHDKRHMTTFTWQILMTSFT